MLVEAWSSRDGSACVPTGGVQMIGRSEALTRIARAALIGGLLVTVAACGATGATPTTSSAPTTTSASVPTATATATSVASATPTMAASASASATASPSAGVQPGTVVAWGLNTYGQATVPA